MSDTSKGVLDRVASWPAEDREELAAVAQEIEQRRQGIYLLSDDERAAIDAARRSAMASDLDVTAFWARVGLA